MGNRLFGTSLLKSLDKQVKEQRTIGPEVGEGELKHKIAKIYSLTCPAFNKYLSDMKRNTSHPYKENKSTIKTFFEEA